MNILYRFFQGISILAMLFFSIPKLTAQAPSVKGFTQFAEVLPVDPYLFMYATGTVELSIVILLLTGLVAELKKITGPLRYTSLLAFVLLLCTMLAALLIEFFVRPAPEFMLVVIALILSIGSVFSIYHKRDLIGNR
jgi:hypothetical protein